MIKEKKEGIINELAGNLSKCAVAITTDYRGLSAKEMVQLRRQMHMQGVEYKVIKNTLARFAAEKAGVKELEQFFTGPMAIAISYDDPVKPAKILNDHIKAANSVLKIKGGVLGKKVLTTADIIHLANTPSREILLAQLMGTMKSPIQSFHFVLSAPIRGLVTTLQARVKQLEAS
jgi:large subunit ribosomal protein L10